MPYTYSAIRIRKLLLELRVMQWTRSIYSNSNHTTQIDMFRKRLKIRTCKRYIYNVLSIKINVLKRKTL